MPFEKGHLTQESSQVLYLSHLIEMAKKRIDSSYKYDKEIPGDDKVFDEDLQVKERKDGEKPPKMERMDKDEDEDMEDMPEKGENPDAAMSQTKVGNTANSKMPTDGKGMEKDMEKGMARIPEGMEGMEKMSKEEMKKKLEESGLSEEGVEKKIKEMANFKNMEKAMKGMKDKGKEEGNMWMQMSDK